MSRRLIRPFRPKRKLSTGFCKPEIFGTPNKTPFSSLFYLSCDILATERVIEYQDFVYFAVLRGRIWHWSFIRPSTIIYAHIFLRRSQVFPQQS